MLKYPDPGRLDQLFKLLERAALAGAPLPRKAALPPCSHALIKELCRIGKIRVVYSGSNWRMAEILTGPAAGMSTACDPKAGKPWKIISEHSGCRMGQNAKILTGEHMDEKPGPICN